MANMMNQFSYSKIIKNRGIGYKKRVYNIDITDTTNCTLLFTTRLTVLKISQELFYYIPQF